MTPPCTFDLSGMYFSKIIVEHFNRKLLKRQESNASATANKSALFSGVDFPLSRLKLLVSELPSSSKKGLCKLRPKETTQKETKRQPVVAPPRETFGFA